MCCRDEIAAIEARVGDGSLHPMQAKRELARTITADFHTAEEGRAR